MAFLKINNVSVVGMSACVPSDILKTEDIYKWDGCESFIGTTGIKQKRCAPKDVCSSDLCIKAAEKLIEELLIIIITFLPYGASCHITHSVHTVFFKL